VDKAETGDVGLRLEGIGPEQAHVHIKIRREVETLFPAMVQRIPQYSHGIGRFGRLQQFSGGYILEDMSVFLLIPHAVADGIQQAVRLPCQHQHACKCSILKLPGKPQRAGAVKIDRSRQHIVKRQRHGKCLRKLGRFADTHEGETAYAASDQAGNIPLVAAFRPFKNIQSTAVFNPAQRQNRLSGNLRSFKGDQYLQQRHGIRCAGFGKPTDHALTIFVGNIQEAVDKPDQTAFTVMQTLIDEAIQ